jgi:hypothetical protein
VLNVFGPVGFLMGTGWRRWDEARKLMLVGKSVCSSPTSCEFHLPIAAVRLSEQRVVEAGVVEGRFRVEVLRLGAAVH